MFGFNISVFEVLAIVAISLLVTALFLIGRYAYNTWRIQCFLRDAREYMGQYQSKITGNNRFVIDDLLLMQAFPDYPAHIVHEGWQEIIRLGWVYQDPYDRAWSVKLTQV